MKTILYIGIYSNGSTSKMRGEKLRSFFPDWKYQIIDTDIPFWKQNRFFRSVGFRYKLGPVVSAINSFILDNLKEDHYDLIWVDKAMLITAKTTKELKKRALRLVHYTPDTAFYANRSRIFYQSIEFYDYLITTKKFETQQYQKLISKDKLIITTQGFDENIHHPHSEFEKKINQVAFVGLAEPSRESILQYLVNNNVPIALAGFGWSNFLKKNAGSAYIDFKGETLWDEQYASLISSSFFALGLLSKRFPEAHTTRTLEIPACGTALLTEKTSDTDEFFTDNDVIFFSSGADLVEKIKYYGQHPAELKILTINGRTKVNNGGFSYTDIMRNILDKIL